MRVLILNGALGPDPLLDELAARLVRDFEMYDDAAVELAVMRETAVAYCQGCFECWTHTPGICKINDAGRDLTRDFVASDVVVLITPVLFGGYSSEAKKMLDRALGMLLPFFRRVDGEVHHQPRYVSPPAFGVLAVLDRHDADIEQAVRVLTTRNAINFASPTHAVGVVERSFDERKMAGVCDSLVEALCATPMGAREPVADVEALVPPLSQATDVVPPSRVLLLVGSAKPNGKSTSESLGLRVMERLETRGIVGHTRYVHRDAHSPEGLRALVAAVREHDLLVIASPVYIDALPSLLTAALEAIAADRADSATRTPLTVAMILNCGFPEARHTAVARTIGALFAREVGARWAGALQLGGGGIIDGQPIEDAGNAVAHIPALLDEAADALAAGIAFPHALQAMFQRPLMPTTLYMAAGDAGWLWTAAHEGSLTKLWNRPTGASSTSHGGIF